TLITSQTPVFQHQIKPVIPAKTSSLCVYRQIRIDTVGGVCGGKDLGRLSLVLKQYLGTTNVEVTVAVAGCLVLVVVVFLDQQALVHQEFAHIMLLLPATTLDPCLLQQYAHPRLG